MKQTSLFSTLLFAALLPNVTKAEVKVYVESAAGDNLGSRLVYAIREGIRESSGLELATLSSDALITTRIVTIDPDEDKVLQGSRTIYSVALTAKTRHARPVEMYLSNNVGSCGSEKIDDCADQVVALTDEWAGKVSRWIEEYERSQQSSPSP